MSSLLVGARMLLLVVFAIAGVAKILDRPGTKRALAEFRVPAAVLPVAAILLPLAELAAAVALVPPASAQWGGLLGLLLLLAFSAGIGDAMRRGRAPDCHCFGQLHSAPAGRSTLLRNVALAVPAAFVAVKGPGPSIATWLADRTAAELVAIATGLAAVVLAAIALRFRQESRALSRMLDDAVDELGAMPRGLPVGAVAPDFSLHTSRGETMTLEGLCAAGRPVALVFVSPNCGACSRVYGAVGRWRAALASDLTVAVISDGGSSENQPVAHATGGDVLLQEDDWSVTKAYRVHSTPTIVVVSPQRRIASGPVSTDPALESLIRLTVRQHVTGHLGRASAVQPVA